MKPSIAIVGCGKVGTVLGRFLIKEGYAVIGVASKSISSAKQTASKVNTDNYSDVPWEITKAADVVFITTPDGIIADTCNSISTNNGFCKNSVVLHCSGSLESTILSSAKKCDATIGSMHPLQSIASKEVDKSPFQGIIMSVEGEQNAVDIAKKIVTDLGASCITIRTEGKTLYHASAVVASNYLVALLDLALKLIQASGVTDKEAFNVLKPLINGTLSNIEKAGTTDALTGPIARGDCDTVKTHIKKIEQSSSDLLEIYKALGKYTIGIANAGKSLNKTTVKNLMDILK